MGLRSICFHHEDWGKQKNAKKTSGPYTKELVSVIMAGKYSREQIEAMNAPALRKAIKEIHGQQAVNSTDEAGNTYKVAELREIALGTRPFRTKKATGGRSPKPRAPGAAPAKPRVPRTEAQKAEDKARSKQNREVRKRLDAFKKEDLIAQAKAQSIPYSGLNKEDLVTALASKETGRKLRNRKNAGAKGGKASPKTAGRSKSKSPGKTTRAASTARKSTGGRATRKSTKPAPLVIAPVLKNALEPTVRGRTRAASPTRAGARPATISPRAVTARGTTSPGRVASPTRAASPARAGGNREELMKLTNDQLKAQLRARKMTVGGKKEELVARLLGQ